MLTQRIFAPLLKQFLIIAGLAGFAFGASAADKRSNVVLIYLDDWAWSGSSIRMNDSMPNSVMPALEMPNFERLAQQGMKFTNAYGSHQCAPARASVQTGQAVARHGMTLVLGKTVDGTDEYDTRKPYSKLPLVPNTADRTLREGANTIAKALKPLGYKSAHFGKWHLYMDPSEAGYDAHSGETDNSQGQTTEENRIPDSMTDPKLMFSITEDAIDFMEEQVAAGTPFYLQISHYAMHAGAECLPQTREKYLKHPVVQAYFEREGINPNNVSRRRDPAVWLGMAEDMDGRIGAVLDKISELGIEDNTYVIAVSDNGYRESNLHIDPEMTQPFHAAKWWAWQAGIRVPMLARGPGIRANSTFEGNVINYDFLPTFYEWAGGDPAALENVDGVSLAGYLAGEKPGPEFLGRSLYFHNPHYRMVQPHSAIVAGTAKVMVFYENPEIPMLFDLSNDPGETSNLAKQYPETHQRLFNDLMGHLEEVDARMPKVNPDFDPEVYKELLQYDEIRAWGAFEGTRPLGADEK